MSKKSVLKTHSQFILEFEQKQPLLFKQLIIIDEYKGGTVKILVQNKYGRCLSYPFNLLHGHPPTMQSAIDKTEYFKNMLKEIQPNIFCKIENFGKIETTSSKFIITVNNENYYTTCNSLLSGKFINIRSSVDKNKSRKKEYSNIHRNFYRYDKVNYINNRTEIIITCPIHGDFNQMPDAHFSGSGCPDCAQINRTEKSKTSQLEYVVKAKEKHGDLYDYSLVEYKGDKIDVDIICKTHGKFTQVAGGHLQGSGCQKCGREIIANSAKENPSGWSIKIGGDKV